MCGIAGILNFGERKNISENLLREMAAPMQFRGPDQEGYFISQSDRYELGLAHKRLSILDLSELGRQPMQHPDKKHCIVFNGEIYNFPEIRKELETEGIAFRSNSDTEVILQAYATWGIDITLQKLNGMFAFALWDAEKQSLILARDRFGEKPLYYYRHNNSLAFGSDIRCFDPLMPDKSIDLHALGYYFAELSTPIENSIYAAVKKLPPAHYLIYTQTALNLFEYWSPDYRKKTKISLHEAIEESERQLELSVKQCLLSDVPVGCFLSGGIDSSLISLYAAKHYGKQIQTFSVGFSYEKFNELPYARQVAQKINSEHHEIILKPDDLNIVDALLREYGEPFADSSQIPSYYVSKFAASKVKVALGGDGGDEIFAGYRTYNQALRMETWHKLRWMKPLLSLLHTLKPSERTAYINGLMNGETQTIGSALYRNMGFSPKQMRTLFENPALFNAAEKENNKTIEQAKRHADTLFDMLLYANIKTRMVNDYFVKTDRASMFNSLELRTPFVSKNLIEFTSTLPFSQIMHGGENKYISKKIAEKYFPKDFIYRPKQGFGIPVGEWIKKEWKSHFYEILNTRQNLVEMNYAYIDKLYMEHINGQANHTDRLWAVYVFHKWVMNQQSM